MRRGMRFVVKRPAFALCFFDAATRYVYFTYGSCFMMNVSSEDPALAQVFCCARLNHSKVSLSWNGVAGRIVCST